MDDVRVSFPAVATMQGAWRFQPMSAAALLDFLRRELTPTPGSGDAILRLALSCLAATTPF
ncbi:MAG: hypothetical protein ACLP29_16050 [Dissulfurispiraceae bacterium]